MALSRHAQCADACPLLGAKRTLTNHCLQPRFMRTRPSLSPDLRQERLSAKEIERQAGGRSNKTPARSCRCFPQRVVSRMKSARLAVFGNRETEKEKSPVAHRAFPVLSPVKASCAKKSVTTPNGQRG